MYGLAPYGVHHYGFSLASPEEIIRAFVQLFMAERKTLIALPVSRLLYQRAETKRLSHEVCDD